MTRDQAAKIYQLAVAVEIAAVRYKRLAVSLSVTREKLTVAQTSAELVAHTQLEAAMLNLKLYRDTL